MEGDWKKMRKLKYFFWSAKKWATGELKEFKFLDQLKKAEKLDTHDIDALQRYRLQALLNHSYANVSYYRSIIDELGGKKALINEDPVNLLIKMPVLTKKILKEKANHLKSNDLDNRKWFFNASGGSTGEPVRFVQDQDYHIYSHAVTRLFDSWTGYETSMPKVVLWGSERDLLVGSETFQTRLGRWLRGEIWLNSFHMTEEKMYHYVEAINRYRPFQILAYVESIYEFVRFIEQKKLTVYSPKAIMTSAGTLYPQMREVIERVFRSPVFNRYGSREVGGIACECDNHKGLHVSPLTHYVEILKEDGKPTLPGEVGEVVVTSLVNFAMPFIRYKIGDMAIWEEKNCSCGRKWPMLKEVVGRETDIFIKKDGTRVVPEYFIHIIGVVLRPSWLRKFQVIQEEYDYIRILIAPSISFEEAYRFLQQEKANLEEKVRAVMGNECRLNIELVEDIFPSSGKFRYTLSKVVKDA